MKEKHYDWRILKRLSNYAFVGMVLFEVLDWYNRDQFEMIMNDPLAKAYWRQTQHFYDGIGWVSLSLFAGLRVCFG